MKKLQISIATKQPLANLLPLLADTPDLLWLLVSDDMQQAADEFLRYTQKLPALANMKVELKTGLPDSPFNAIGEFALELASQLDEQYADWVKTYNITGGTKLMAVALTSIFTEEGFHQIYIDTANNRIEQIFPKGASFALPDLLDTRTYLEAHDMTWRRAQSDDSEWLSSVLAREPATFHFAKAVARTENAGDFLSMMNQQLANALNKHKQLEQPQIDLRFVPAAFQDVFATLSDANFIDYEKEEKRIYLRSEESHRYLSGAWLEEYFYLVAQRAGLTDFHSGIAITDNYDSKKNIRNELDGVATYGNRVLLVECKTSSFGKDQTKDSSIVYKLDSIAHQVGGIFFTPLLLSAQPLDHTTSANRDVYTTARANAADIQVMAGKDLLKLEAALKYWMKNGRWPVSLKDI